MFLQAKYIYLVNKVSNTNLLFLDFADPFLLDLRCLVGEPQSCVTMLNKHNGVSVLNIRLPHPLFFRCFQLFLFIL